jgi:poly-gamma-glutamate synthesis protein (capsule biosynthesis protein)
MSNDPNAPSAPRSGLIRLFLCGDIMTGRGIDQILPHPGNPALHEPFLHDARRYVQLAERASGALPRPVSFDYIWGEALLELEHASVDVRIVNLETSITRSDDWWDGKQIHYRMSPDNAPCLTAAGIDCCCLANNHILDWGYDGLTETLRTLDAIGIDHTGAGRNEEEAAAPATIEVPGKGRVLVFSYGSPTSGVPFEWAAKRNRAGINFIEELSETSARRVARYVSGFRREGDVTVASIHSGGNWGFETSDAEIRFFHTLVEEGIDIVHGHSSHHLKTVELRDGRLVLHGCGDFLNDYEGIQGYEEFRGDLRLMYFADIDASGHELVHAWMIPMQLERFRLHRTSAADADWIRDLLNELGAKYGTQVELAADGSLHAIKCESAHVAA